MYKIRQIKYTSDSVSIQVYKIENRKRVIVRHIGTARNEQEKSDLASVADDPCSRRVSRFALCGRGHGDLLSYFYSRVPSLSPSHARRHGESISFDQRKETRRELKDKKTLSLKE